MNRLRMNGRRKRKPHRPPQTMRGYNQRAESWGAIFTPNAEVMPTSPKIQTARLFKRPPKQPAANTKLSFFARFFTRILLFFLIGTGGLGDLQDWWNPQPVKQVRHRADWLNGGVSSVKRERKESKKGSSLPVALELFAVSRFLAYANYHHFWRDFQYHRVGFVDTMIAYWILIWGSNPILQNMDNVVLEIFGPQKEQGFVFSIFPLQVWTVTWCLVWKYVDRFHYSWLGVD